MRSDVGSPVDFQGGLGTVLPADLVAVVLVTVLADVVVVVGAPQAAQLAAAGVLLFFLPGYAIVAALYPGATPRAEESDARSGLGIPERLALSFGTSVATVAVLGLAVWQVGAMTTGGEISTSTSLALLTLFVVAGCSAAAVRRSRRPRTDRFSLPYRRWVGRARAAVFGGDSRPDRLLSVALAASILLAGGALGYAVSTPVEAEQYTSASLLTEQPDGELEAAGYPTELQAGESGELILELENHEGAATTYTTVVRIEQVDTAGAEPTVTEATELDRLSVGVPPGEARTVAHEVAPEMTGDRLRLSYYVYRGAAPSNPSTSSAYRHLYIRLSVEG